ncbi:MAG: response regulator [Syntrophobacter sp.]
MPRVMIIDDERYIRDWYSLELSSLGYEVNTAGCCNKLLKRIEMFRPDLVILDIRLVDCDGLEMLQQIRNSHPDLPVILCSAYDSYRFEVKSLAADYYVVKSFDLTELKDKVRRALETTAPALTDAI